MLGQAAWLCVLRSGTCGRPSPLGPLPAVASRFACRYRGLVVRPASPAGGTMAEAAAGASGEAMAALVAAEGSLGPAGWSAGRSFSNYRPFEPQTLGFSPSWRLTSFSGMKG